MENANVPALILKNNKFEELCKSLNVKCLEEVSQWYNGTMVHCRRGVQIGTSAFVHIHSSSYVVYTSRYKL